MQLRKVKIANFRCLSDVEFSPGPGLNVVVAKNGGGKTTLVNAIGFGLLGASAMKFPLGTCVRRDSVGRSFVFLSGDFLGNSFTVYRALSPRKLELKVGDSVYTTKAHEANAYFEQAFISPRVFRTTLCCFQREVDLLVQSDLSARRRFLYSLLQLDAIERAIESMSLVAVKTSVEPLREQIRKTREELAQLPEIKFSEKALSDLLFLKSQLRLLTPEQEKRVLVERKVEILRVLGLLIEKAKVLGGSRLCPLCGNVWNPQELYSRELEVKSALGEALSEIQNLPPKPVISKDAAEERLKELPDLSEAECQRQLELIRRRRELEGLLRRLESSLQEVEKAKHIKEARALLREFFHYVAEPFLTFLSQCTRRLLTLTPFADFRISPEFEFLVGDEPVGHLSTAQRDFVMTCFRIAVTKTFLVARGTEPLPLFLDSIGDAMDDENFERLLSLLASEEMNTFTQIFLTTHRNVPAPHVIRL